MNTTELPVGGMDEDPERDDLVYRLRVVNRLSQREIAERVGISQQRVSQLLARMEANLPPVDVGAIRAESLRLLRHAQREALILAEMQGAPVTAGKDGMIIYDPTVTLADGSHPVVREYSGRNAALKLAIEADKEIRKLTGADAASKVESTGTVRYELAFGPDVLT